MELSTKCESLLSEDSPVPIGSLVEITKGINKGSRLFIVHIIEKDDGNFSYGMSHNLKNIIEIKSLQRDLQLISEYRQKNSSTHSQVNHDFAERLIRESLESYKKSIEYSFQHDEISLISLPHSEVEIVFKNFILNQQ